MSCPFCGSQSYESAYPRHAGMCITSDLRLVSSSHIDNRICEDCGFVWNEGGPRGRTDAFYRDSYQLRMHAPNAQNINFSGAGARPMARAIADFLVADPRVGASGSILEAGAGKGEFLTQFLGLRPSWSSFAFEPSSAFETLTARLPGTRVLRGGYEDVEIDGQFDIVASLAVIEHVEDPLSFMRWLRDRVAPGGILLLTCPDFALNPNDLLCVDHLSKFTLPQLEMVARRAGLAVVRLTHVGIAMVVVLQQVLPSDAVAGVRDFTSSVVRGNEAKAQAMIACIGRAQRAATRDGTRMAIFGLGMTGLFAPMVEGFPRSEIAAYIDENPTMHGQRIEGVPIVDLHEIPGLGIGHVALSVSPIYQDQVIDKLGPFGVTIHV